MRAELTTTLAVVTLTSVGNSIGEVMLMNDVKSFQEMALCRTTIAAFILVTAISAITATPMEANGFEEEFNTDRTSKQSR